jgi:hypothetical protein
MAITTRNFERERDPTIGRENNSYDNKLSTQIQWRNGRNGMAEKTLMETVDRMAIAKSN